MKTEVEAGRGCDRGEVNEKRREGGTTNSGCNVEAVRQPDC